jgi:hypothetical protein
MVSTDSSIVNLSIVQALSRIGTDEYVRELPAGEVERMNATSASPTSAAPRSASPRAAPPGDQGAQHRMDLLTVLDHEVGHLLGKEHEAQGVMAETLTAGSRHVPRSNAHQADLGAALAPGDVPSEAATWPDPISAWSRRK